MKMVETGTPAPQQEPVIITDEPEEDEELGPGPVNT